MLSEDHWRDFPELSHHFCRELEARSSRANFIFETAVELRSGSVKMQKVICVATFALLFSVHLVAAVDETVNLPSRIVTNEFINEVS